MGPVQAGLLLPGDRRLIDNDRTTIYAQVKVRKPMKKRLPFLIALLFAATTIVGCGEPQAAKEDPKNPSPKEQSKKADLEADKK